MVMDYNTLESRQAEEKKPAGIDQWSFKQVKVENAAGTGSEFDGTDSDEKKNVPLAKKSRKRKYCIWAIACLDNWNKRGWRRNGKKSLEGADLREKYPLCIPVSVEKDAGSDIPDINMKKFLIPSDMLLRKFVRFLRGYSKKPMFVFFKNTTQPPTGVLMSAIDEENKDSDGYLHVIYSGNDHLSGLFEELKLSS
ncbi:autophagy-related protein 8C-like [Prunus persica]|uniref:autophagy-related protein 8C-like n=1 Tax=Prunus persica TaxID=3760 RepID=UPI0009AB55F8|nr:autophagy-related protein 8C-like [Prunus persica]